MQRPLLRVGVVGCGVISDVYIRNAHRLGGYEVVACADLDSARAEAAAAHHGIHRACAVPELLEDPGVELVLNLTPPAAHAEVGLAAVEAGKHLYNEKPLTIEPVDARRILETAALHGRLVGCAPDTFLGAGLQTCRRLVDDGAIGRPVAATAFMLCHGHESWHPDPAFYYLRGGGPLFDMGPYDLTALMHLLGPVRRVTGPAGAGFAEREVTSQPRAGERIIVETPTHFSTTLEFEDGAIGTLVMSFDVWSHSLPCLEIYGAGGTLRAPDPNTFGGPVHLRRHDEETREVELGPWESDDARGLGIAALAAASGDGTEPRASGALACHVLDTMHAIVESASRRIAVDVPSRVDRPPVRTA